MNASQLLIGLVNASPETLASVFASHPDMKRKLATAMQCETIESQRALLDITHAKLAVAERAKGKSRIPFNHIGRMQTLFLQATPETPDPYHTYRMDVHHACRRVREANQRLSPDETPNTYIFRLIRVPGGALVANVPSSEYYNWTMMQEEYAKYSLTPPEPTHWRDIEAMKNAVRDLTNVDINHRAK